MGIKSAVSLALAEYNLFIRKTLPRPSTLFAKQVLGNKPITVLEIGTYEARNAVSIMKELNVKSLTCIDPYQYYDDEQLTMIQLDEAKQRAYSRLGSYGKKIKWIHATSHAAIKKIPDNSIDFIYIDGDHRYEYVKFELEHSWKKLKSGGVIAGHDIDWPGVVQAIGEFTLHNNLKLHLRYPDWMIQK